jgi:hypothetical protein
MPKGEQQEMSMKKLLLAAALTLAFTGTALANQCPGLMQKIDDAMKTAQLNDDDKAKVMGLYNKGKAEHVGGQHAESINSLNEALKILGM